MSEPQYIPLTPDSGPATVWTRLVRIIWRRFPIFAAVVGISFAIIYDETATRLFFNTEGARLPGDPCLTLMWPTRGPDVGRVWSSFGHCRGRWRDPHRVTVEIDVRFGLLTNYKTEPLLSDSLPMPFTRVTRNRDSISRAFGKGSTLTFDMGLTEVEGRPGVNLVLAGGGRFYFGPGLKPGWLTSDVGVSWGYEGLEWTGQDWRLHLDDEKQMVFPDSTHARRFEQAALLRLQDADRRDLIVLDRDDAGNIVHLTAGSERADLDHDELNRLTAIRVPAGRQEFRFDYDSTGCLIHQSGSGGEFQYDYDRRGGACRLSELRAGGIRLFLANYGADDRIVGLTDSAGGSYTFSYEEDKGGNVVRAEVRDPEGTLRHVRIDRAGYWFSHWGSYRGR